MAFDPNIMQREKELVEKIISAAKATSKIANSGWINGLNRILV